MLRENLQQIKKILLGEKNDLLIYHTSPFGQKESYFLSQDMFSVVLESNSSSERYTRFKLSSQTLKFEEYLKEKSQSVVQMECISAETISEYRIISSKQDIIMGNNLYILTERGLAFFYKVLIDYLVFKGIEYKIEGSYDLCENKSIEKHIEDIIKLSQDIT